MTSGTDPRILASDEVILFTQNGTSAEDYHSANVTNYRSNDIAYAQQLINHMSRESKLANHLAKDCSASVILMDKMGWQKGTVKLELVFYPEAAEPTASETEDLAYLFKE